MKTTKIFCISIALFTTQIVNASWVSVITGIDIDLNRGKVSINTPQLDKIPQMLQNMPKDVSQALLNPAAPVLATAIRFSRGQALNRGTSPIPPNIREKLQPYFPEHILNKVRWTTANGISLDGALKNLFNQEGAITLDDVVVFSNADAVNSDVSLWAHELTHVLQYHQMGVETFAFQYSYDWNALESQARTNQNKIMESILATQQNKPRTWLSEITSASTSPQIQWNQMNDLAKQGIPPESCIWIDQQTNTTGNKCPISIRVTGVMIQRLQDGFMFTAPCNEQTCNFLPNQSGPLLSPFGHRIVGVTAAYPN